MTTRTVPMTRAFDDLERRAAEVTNREELRALCDRAAEHLGLEAYTYLLRQSNSFIDPELVVLSSYPEALVGRYRREQMVLVDAVARYCYRHSLPATWASIWDRSDDPVSRERLLGAFAEHGLEWGFVVPLHSARGELSLLSGGGRDTPAFRRKLQQNMPLALYLLAVLHDAATRLIDQRFAVQEQVAELTEREHECLVWCAEGKTSWETAQILGISERTVVFHLQNVNVKLGVSSRQQAVARAMALGLLVPVIQWLPDEV
ncbi:MAG: LuxR family transcriptional regulator [Ectothiorhodospiraceae bacterium]|nr:LuxR family transcriptional regulator [Ectothiorhodospiraceae bacterium]MCH8504508.1 LuxR family transcriptional regulator [Ectothiorhodospiraceae bacterium]